MAIQTPTATNYGSQALMHAAEMQNRLVQMAQEERMRKQAMSFGLLQQGLGFLGDSALGQQRYGQQLELGRLGHGYDKEMAQLSHGLAVQTQRESAKSWQDYNLFQQTGMSAEEIDAAAEQTGIPRFQVIDNRMSERARQATEAQLQAKGMVPEHIGLLEQATQSAYMPQVDARQIGMMMDSGAQKKKAAAAVQADFEPGLSGAAKNQIVKLQNNKTRIMADQNMPENKKAQMGAMIDMEVARLQTPSMVMRKPPSPEQQIAQGVQMFKQMQAEYPDAEIDCDAGPVKLRHKPKAATEQKDEATLLSADYDRRLKNFVLLYGKSEEALDMGQLMLNKAPDLYKYVHGSLPPQYGADPLAIMEDIAKSRAQGKSDGYIDERLAGSALQDEDKDALKEVADGIVKQRAFLAGIGENPYASPGESAPQPASVTQPRPEEARAAMAKIIQQYGSFDKVPDNLKQQVLQLRVIIEGR